MTEPQMTGREHWLVAERLVGEADRQADPELARLAQVHAMLALAAPAYAFHQVSRFADDSPNILKGQNEAPVPIRTEYGKLIDHDRTILGEH